MKLSAEQALRAYDYLQRKGPHTVDRMTPRHDDIPIDLVERILSRIACTPDPRPERVEHATDALEGQLPTSEEVAERIIWRELADSIR